MNIIDFHILRDYDGYSAKFDLQPCYLYNMYDTSDFMDYIVTRYYDAGWKFVEIEFPWKDNKGNDVYGHCTFSK